MAVADVEVIAVTEEEEVTIKEDTKAMEITMATLEVVIIEVVAVITKTITISNITVTEVVTNQKEEEVAIHRGEVATIKVNNNNSNNSNKRHSNEHDGLTACNNFIFWTIQFVENY